MEEFTHYTVMKNEAVDALECQDGKIYVDCTLGGGGHSGLILSRIQPNGRLIAFDVDEDAIKASSERLKDYKNLTIVKDSYTNIKEVLHSLGVEKITGGVLFDLGASYHQFHKGERGFSFSKDFRRESQAKNFLSALSVGHNQTKIFLPNQTPAKTKKAVIIPESKNSKAHLSKCFLTK